MADQSSYLTTSLISLIAMVVGGGVLRSDDWGGDTSNATST